MKILHLYYDIMNLYGEYANVSALKRIFEKSGIDTQVDKLSLSDTAVLSDYDIIYIGSGTERNQKLVLEDMRKYKAELEKCIDEGKVILMTGNSFEILGKSITDCEGKLYEGLGYLFSRLSSRIRPASPPTPYSKPIFQIKSLWALSINAAASQR